MAEKEPQPFDDQAEAIAKMSRGARSKLRSVGVMPKTIEVADSIIENNEKSRKEQQKIKEMQEKLKHFSDNEILYFSTVVLPDIIREIESQGINLSLYEAESKESDFSADERYWVKETIKREAEKILLPFFSKNATEDDARNYFITLAQYKQEIVLRLLNVQKEKIEEKRQQKLTEIIGRLRDLRPSAHPRDAAADEINLFDED